MNLGMSEMIFIFLAALILVGPKKLPEIMRTIGKFMNEFKRASNEFKWQIESEINNLELEAERAKQQILPPSPAPPATPPQGTIASGSIVEAQPTRVEALASGSPSSTNSPAESSAAGSMADTPAGTPDYSEALSPAKSVDA